MTLGSNVAAESQWHSVAERQNSLQQCKYPDCHCMYGVPLMTLTVASIYGVPLKTMTVLRIHGVPLTTRYIALVSGFLGNVEAPS